MGNTGGESTTRSESSTDGLKKKNLNITVVFAPIARSKLLSMYDPIENPNPDREIVVINRMLEFSSNYKPSKQDKYIFINCSSAKVALLEDGDVIPQTESLMDKLKRAIELVHSTLDFWHGYTGTVNVTFSCYKKFEPLMEALQIIMKCPSYSKPENSYFSSAASSKYSSAFDKYPQWKFVAKYYGIVEAEYQYVVRNNKSDIDVLKERNAQLVKTLSPEEQEIYNNAQPFHVDTSKGLGYANAVAHKHAEDCKKYNTYLANSPKDSAFRKVVNQIAENNNQILDIQEQQKKEQQEWNALPKAEKIKRAQKQIEDDYNQRIAETEKRNAPLIQQLKGKRMQLGYQNSDNGGESQFYKEFGKRSYDAYDKGLENHEAYHRRDQIDYNGEYYTIEELDKMYYNLTGQKKLLEKQKEEAIRKAKAEINKQDRRQRIDFIVAIFNIVSIVLTPLVIVDIIVIAAKMCSEEEETSISDAVSIALDIFALIPFVGVAFKFERFAALTTASSQHIVQGAIKGQVKIQQQEMAIANRLLEQSKYADKIGDTMRIKGNKATFFQNKDAAKANQLLDFSKQHYSNADFLRGGVEFHSEKAFNALDTIEATQQRLSYLGKGLLEHEGVFYSLPVVSFGEWVHEIAFYAKNLSTMSKETRAAAVANLRFQGAQHAANAYAAVTNVSTVKDSLTGNDSQNPPQSVIMVSNHYNFILAVCK